MTGDEILACLRTPHALYLRRCFPGLSERDLMLVLTAPERAVPILQRCLGGEVTDGKAAWNDYVLRYLDGEGCDLAARPPGSAAANW
jgi:hypothetical protein